MADCQFKGLRPLLACLALTLSACEQQEISQPDTLQDPAPAQVDLPPPDWKPALLADSRVAVRALGRAIDAFIERPGEETRASWQSAWRASHDAFIRTNLLVPDPAAHVQIDPWPIMPGFVDSLPAYPASGIINDETLSIDVSTINQQHQITDESEIALGFHIIEYYAFDRPLEDFLTGEQNNNRRRQFLTLVAEQLVANETERATRVELNLETLTYAGASITMAVSVRRLATEMSDWESHGEFSDSAHHSLRTQLITLQNLLGNETGLSHYLIDLDMQNAIAVNKTLAKIVEMTGNAEDTMEAPEQIGVLLSGLALQLESIASSAAAGT